MSNFLNAKGDRKIIAEGGPKEVKELLQLCCERPRSGSENAQQREKEHLSISDLVPRKGFQKQEGCPHQGLNGKQEIAGNEFEECI